MKTIILASNNLGKIKEISELLKQVNVDVKSLKDLGLKDPIEDGKDFAENSLIKAKYVFENTDLPSLADDSGFCIESMNNFPGLSSARFIKSVGSEEKAFEIINACINLHNKNAYFITSLAFIYRDNEDKIIYKNFEGIIKGIFSFPAKGEGGFGFDSVFIPNGYDKTFAEIPEIKIQISHRTIALNKFLEFFKTL